MHPNSVQIQVHPYPTSSLQPVPTKKTKQGKQANKQKQEQQQQQQKNQQTKAIVVDLSISQAGQMEPPWPTALGMGWSQLP